MSKISNQQRVDSLKQWLAWIKPQQPRPIVKIVKPTDNE